MSLLETPFTLFFIFKLIQYKQGECRILLQIPFCSLLFQDLTNYVKYIYVYILSNGEKNSICSMYLSLKIYKTLKILSVGNINEK